MTENDLVYLLELLMKSTERALADALRRNHQDQACRNALSDYLEEDGRVASAEKVRGGYTPGGMPSFREAAGAFGLSGYGQPFSVTSGGLSSGSIGFAPNDGSYPIIQPPHRTVPKAGRR